MSGGHFNDSGYVYYKISQFADELENELEEKKYFAEYEPEVLKIMKEALPSIRRTAKMMKEIDYYFSGDTGEESFLRRIKELD